jgi:hypothetical protein
MNISVKVLLSLCTLILFSTSVSSGQEEPKEQRIKVIVSEKDKDISSAGNGHKIAVCEDMANQSADSSDSISAIQPGGKEMTKYIIRKNGMVITIEGTDYEKVRILQGEIENLLKTREEFRKERSE